MQIRLLIILLCFLTSNIFGQTLKSEIDNIYNFKPSKLSKSEQELKLPPLDKFWEKVKSDTTQYLPQLRDELNAANHNPFFYFDGSALLLSLSRNSFDKQLAANSIAHCDLDDISQREYVKTLNRLSNEGINVTNAAIKILSDTNFSFFIPQHAMTFNQGYCLSYMLLPEKKELWVDTLVSLFKTVDPISQKAIITTFWFAYSCKGDSLINSAMRDKSLNNEVSQYCKTIMGYTNLSKDQKAYLKMLDKNELSNLRQESLRRFSDEAIDELDLTTRLMRKENNCR